MISKNNKLVLILLNWLKNLTDFVCVTKDLKKLYIMYISHGSKVEKNLSSSAPE